MLITKSINLKCDVSAENTQKIMESLEEEFGKVASNVEIDDQEAIVSTIKAGLSNMHITNAKVELTEKKDGKGYTIKITGMSKLSVVFWISCGISVLLFFPLLLADVGIVFYNKTQIEKVFDSILNAVKDEIC